MGATSGFWLLEHRGRRLTRLVFAWLEHSNEAWEQEPVETEPLPGSLAIGLGKEQVTGSTDLAKKGKRVTPPQLERHEEQSIAIAHSSQLSLANTQEK